MPKRNKEAELYPTRHLTNLLAYKAELKKLVHHSRKSVQPSSAAHHTKTFMFIGRGVTPVDLPSCYKNKPLDSTRSKQAYTGGSKTRVIWSGGTRYGSFPKGEK